MWGAADYARRYKSTVNMENEYKESIRGKTTYLLSIVTCFVQERLSGVIVFLFAKPCLFFVRKRVPAQSNGYNPKNPYRYKFDCSRSSHRILLAYWHFVMRNQKRISGLQAGRDAYKKLLEWDLGIPILGFEKNDQDITVEMLTPKQVDPMTGEEAQFWDAYWVYTNAVAGKIKLLHRNVSPVTNEIEIVGVWKSGKFAGKTFTLNSEESALPTTVGLNDNRPTHIYVAPTLLIWAIAIGFLAWQFAARVLPHLSS